jgi:hypothetical protein
MQVLCEKSNMGSDVRCGVCGQGFLVYWERTSRAERMQARAAVMNALVRQHENERTGHDVHPETRFTIPDWDGDVRYSGAALLGGAKLVSA